MENGISIIVPIFNTKMEYLKKCVDSLVNQTYSNIEILLINDGSTNGNILKFIEMYEKSDKRIVGINKNNSGVSATRNVGIKKAQKKWIMFVDADDWLDENACELFIQNIDNDLIDIVISNNYRDVGIETKIVKNKCHNSHIIKDNYEKKELIDSIFCEENIKYNYVDAPWAKIYKKDFLENNNIFFKEDLKMAEDGLFNFEAYSKSHEIKYFHNPTYHYRKNDDSVCNKYNEFIVENYKLVFEYYNKMLKNGEICLYEEEYNYFIFRQIKKIMKKYFYSRENPKNIVVLKKELLDFLDNQNCKNSIKKINWKKLSFRNKVMLFAIKSKSYVLKKIVFSY